MLVRVGVAHEQDLMQRQVYESRPVLYITAEKKAEPGLEPSLQQTNRTTANEVSQYIFEARFGSISYPTTGRRDSTVHAS